MDKQIMRKENFDDGELINEELASQAGLTICGSDNEGQTEYIGTTKEWDKFESLKGQEFSTCCHAKPVEEFRDNILDHQDPIEIYICSKCGKECETETLT